jgi:hypothetical protein
MGGRASVGTETKEPLIVLVSLERKTSELTLLRQQVPLSSPQRSAAQRFIESSEGLGSGIASPEAAWYPVTCSQSSIRLFCMCISRPVEFHYWNKSLLRISRSVDTHYGFDDKV